MFMFGRFTERAQQVLVLAQEEAKRLNHNFIEHRTHSLGLVVKGRGLPPGRCKFGVELPGSVPEEKIIGKEKRFLQGISYTPRLKK